MKNTEAGIEVHEEVVLMTTKGEAIALGIAQMSTVELSSCDHGVVAKVKRCIMERDLYPRRWGMGPVAIEKKKMKDEGKLDKYGRPNAATPAKWNNEYKDFTAPAEEGAVAIASHPKPEAVSVAAPAAPASADGNAANDDEEKSDKKRKRHDGETAEEKAERKRKKKEKKAKRESKKSAAGSSDSE